MSVLNEWEEFFKPIIGLNVIFHLVMIKLFKVKKTILRFSIYELLIWVSVKEWEIFWLLDFFIIINIFIILNEFLVFGIKQKSAMLWLEFNYIVTSFKNFKALKLIIIHYLWCLTNNWLVFSINFKFGLIISFKNNKFFSLSDIPVIMVSVKAPSTPYNAIMINFLVQVFVCIE